MDVVRIGYRKRQLAGLCCAECSDRRCTELRQRVLPAIYGGTKVGRGGRGRAPRVGSSGESVPDIKNPKLSETQQQKQLKFIQALNRDKLRRDQEQPGVEGVIESFELAFRMQEAMPELMDISDESDSTLALYGADGGPTESFGKQCLLARRFIEAGVRFVELTHGQLGSARQSFQRSQGTCGRL